MGTVIGIGIVIVIVLIAGLIAYIGDRVGHQVGRKRMTLFGLRPKYTSTIVAVGTGMMIALVATVVTLSTSPYARAAFFQLSEINTQVNELQAKADALERQVRLNNVVVDRGHLLYGQFLLLTPQQTSAERMKIFSAFFDTVVDNVNRNYVPQGLKPYRGRASDTDVSKKLQAVLSDPKTQGFSLRGTVLLVAIADENLFPGDPIHFTFAPYLDQLIFHNRQAIASVEVDGGTAIVPQIAYGQLADAIQQSALAAGMPVYFASPFASASPAAIAQTQAAIKAGRGRFYIIARATSDVYPHTGGVPVAFELSRSAK